MFSALSQGSPIFLLDKTSTLDYKVGEVVGVSAPKFNSFGNTVDLKIKVDDSIQEFNNISSVSNYTSYNNGKIIISESKQSIQNEIEGILQNRKQILNNIDVYKEEIIQCENILKQLSPQFAIDRERDERLSNLETRFDGVESKLDKIFDLIKK